MSEHTETTDTTIKGYWCKIYDLRYIGVRFAVVRMVSPRIIIREENEKFKTNNEKMDTYKLDWGD